MKDNTKRKILPSVIVTVIAVYYIAIGVYFAYMKGVPTLAKVFALVVPGIIMGAAGTKLIERIGKRKKDKTLKDKDEEN